jgi:hypothetical protein
MNHNLYECLFTVVREHQDGDVGLGCHFFQKQSDRNPPRADIQFTWAATNQPHRAKISILVFFIIVDVFSVIDDKGTFDWRKF